MLQYVAEVENVQPKGVLGKQIFFVVSQYINAKMRCVHIAQMFFYEMSNWTLFLYSLITVIDISTLNNSLNGENPQKLVLRIFT